MSIDKPMTEEVEADLQIEVVDDTPEQDQGRRPVAAQDDGEHEEELENYSEKVQKRITNGFRLFGKYYRGLWD